jgi:hypothetical protein
MLLLLIDSLLLYCITTSLGIFALAGLNKLFRCTIQSDPLGVVLIGLSFSTIYFSIISFWRPLDYYSLVPLIVISLLMPILLKKNYWILVHNLISRFKKGLHAPYLIPAVCLLVLLLCYLTLPPLNVDAPRYHYECIRWYEKYKVIPGLANVHGRFAFDPASFIIAGPYSLSDLSGQAIYPLNAVIISLLLFWLLARVIRNRGSFAGVAYFAGLVILSRALFALITSTSSDLLMTVCIAYSLLRLFELLLSREISVAKVAIPLIIVIFAPVAKLSAYPVLFAIPFFLYLLPHSEKRQSFVLVYVAFGIVLYVPWIIRNYIMSGYLVYPFPYLDLFHPDWKAPRDVLMSDYYYIRYGAMSVIGSKDDLTRYQHESFFQLFPAWVTRNIKGRMVPDLLLFGAGLLSPLVWIVNIFRRIRTERTLFLFWLIPYAGIWIWLFTCPDYRFGIVFFVLSLTLPLLALAQGHRLMSPRTQTNLLAALFALYFLNYFFEANCLKENIRIKYHYAFTWEKNLLYPLKDLQYTMKNNLADFPYTILNNGVKLYLSDSNHFCLNADQPCMSWKYGKIEMRGPRIDQGFRNIKDEAWDNFPFLLNNP